MKNNLPFLSLLLFAALMFSSCKKGLTITAGPLPTGTFSGYFEAYHLNPRTNKRDTTFEWVTLTLSGANGFTIKGDTTVHSGSTNMQADGNGAYAQDGPQYMQFSDKNFPAANQGAAAKYHLNGLYLYAYIGQNFSLATASADTLYLSYSLSANAEPIK